MDGNEGNIKTSLKEYYSKHQSAVVRADIRVHSRSSKMYSESFYRETWDWNWKWLCDYGCHRILASSV